jgi:hypothetical protein
MLGIRSSAAERRDAGITIDLDEIAMPEDPRSAPDIAAAFRSTFLGARRLRQRRSRPRLREGAVIEALAYRRLVPVTTISACRPPQREPTSLSRQSRTLVSAPYRAAISAGSGPT